MQTLYRIAIKFSRENKFPNILLCNKICKKAVNNSNIKNPVILLAINYFEIIILNNYFE